MYLNECRYRAVYINPRQRRPPYPGPSQNLTQFKDLMNRTGIRPLIRSTSSPWVLSISQDGQDYNDLISMVDPASTIINASTLRSGLDTMARVRIAVVLCDSDVRPGSWRDVLRHTENWQVRPHLVVTSRLADESLWAEALNLGAYDALAKPFDSEEVRRVVDGALNNWIRRHQPVPFALPEFNLFEAMKSA